MESGSGQTEATPTATGVWLLPSSDDEEEGGPEVRLLSVNSQASRGRLWMRRNLAALEEYFICLIVPAALCVFAVSALTTDWYATQLLVLSPTSSLLFEPSPWLVNSIQIEVIDGQSGPVFYGFTAVPVLGAEASWNESHSMVVAPGHIEEFALWLNKGSFLNVSCSIKQPGVSHVLLRVLEEHKTTQSWIEDYAQQSESQCDQATDKGLHYVVPRDGNYSVTVDNLDEENVEILLGFEVHATLYSTDSAVYLCLPYPKACQLQISLFGNRIAVLSTPSDSQSLSWEAKLSYKVRWITLATFLGSAFLMASATFKIVSRLQSAYFHERRERERRLAEELEWGDDDGVDSMEDSLDNGFCAICLNAHKDSFFIPCGHSETCLTCGLKLKDEERGVCPVCNEAIEVVKHLFHV